jgi:hypothetical protein
VCVGICAIPVGAITISMVSKVAPRLLGGNFSIFKKVYPFFDMENVGHTKIQI